MRIGQLAQTANVSTKTVRYYESIGLMPEPDRNPSGYRDYGPEAVQRLRFIRDSQATGLTLVEILSILDLNDRRGRACDETRAMLRKHITRIDRQIGRLQAARQELANVATGARPLDQSQRPDPDRSPVLHPAANRADETTTKGTPTNE